MSLKYSTSNIILPNLVPSALFPPKPWERLSTLGTRLYFTHRNVDDYFKKNLRVKAKADTRTPNSRTTNFQGPVIYDSEGTVALSLGLINLGGQCVSGHVVRASFVSDTPPKCLDRKVGSIKTPVDPGKALGLTCVSS